MSATTAGWVWDHSPYKGERLLVHLAIGDVANDLHGNLFWMTTGALADKARCSRSTVTTTLTDLVERDLLEVVEEGGGRGRPTVYRFLRPPDTARTARTSPPPKPRAPRPQTARPAIETARPTETTPLTRTKETQEGQLTPRVAALATQPIPDVVFDAWVHETARTERTVLTPKRRRLIEARVREGYTLDDLLAVTRGWKLSPWHCGANPEGKVYNDFELLFRDAQKVEGFRDLDRGTANAGAARARAHEDPAVASIRRLREQEGRA